MSIEENLLAIEARIRAACQRTGRDRNSVTLMAVTKGQPPEVVAEAARLGITLFGENKVQEARAKIGLCPSHCRWHLIGHLQSNKARDAVHFFEMIHSIDSLPLAAEVNRVAEKSGKTMPVLLEVNVAGESTKFGYNPNSLLAEIAALNALPRLEIHGLMAMAPWSQDPEKARPIFRKVRQLKESLEQTLGAPLPHLSMGMSGDFEPAVEEGATIVRIGTALLGPRRSLIRPAGE